MAASGHQESYVLDDGKLMTVAQNLESLNHYWDLPEGVEDELEEGIDPDDGWE